MTTTITTEYETIIYSNACPDCGGTLLDYDDYSICEYVEHEDHEYVGLVACGFAEGCVCPHDLGDCDQSGECPCEYCHGPRKDTRRDLTGISILAPLPPVVDCTALVPESFETPLGAVEEQLPEGWDPDGFYRLEVDYGRRVGPWYLPQDPTPCDQAALKGEWDDDLPARRPLNTDGFTIEHVPAVPLADLRDPDWRYGFGGMYRDAEGAAANVTYVEGEPVVPEQPVIAWDDYPWSWDTEPELLSGAPVRGPGLERRHR